MKKKWILILSIGALVVLGAVLLLTHDFGAKPFADLKAEDLASAQVEYYNWTKEVKDKDELVRLLQEIMIYREHRNWQNLSGAPTVVKLTYQDGHTAILRNLNTIFVIDDVGYKTQYRPAYELSEYIYDLLDIG